MLQGRAKRTDYSAPLQFGAKTLKYSTGAGDPPDHAVAYNETQRHSYRRDQD